MKKKRHSWPKEENLVTKKKPRKNRFSIIKTSEFVWNIDAGMWERSISVGPFKVWRYSVWTPSGILSKQSLKMEPGESMYAARETKHYLGIEEFLERYKSRWMIPINRTMTKELEAYLKDKSDKIGRHNI